MTHHAYPLTNLMIWFDEGEDSIEPCFFVAFAGVALSEERIVEGWAEKIVVENEEEGVPMATFRDDYLTGFGGAIFHEVGGRSVEDAEVVLRGGCPPEIGPLNKVSKAGCGEGGKWAYQDIAGLFVGLRIYEFGWIHDWEVVCV